MLDAIADLNISDSAERLLWKAEASKWRLPYFDWGLAKRQSLYDFGIPVLYTLETLSLQVPEGHAPLTVNNPLWSYHFRNELGDSCTMKDLGISFDGGFNVSQQTHHRVI